MTTILLTHQHPDHTGGVAELRRRSGARVVAHQADAPVITGARTLVLTPIQRIGVIFMPVPEPSPVDVLMGGDSQVPVPGFSAVHTPGHTPGHVSYLLKRDGGVLLLATPRPGVGAKCGERRGCSPTMWLPRPRALSVWLGWSLRWPCSVMAALYAAGCSTVS